MPFKKGQAKKGGRAKGTPNKSTSEIREAYQVFVENNIPNFEKWIERVAEKNPAKALELVTSLSEYFIPKLQRTETDLTSNGKEINIPTINFEQSKDDNIKS